MPEAAQKTAPYVVALIQRDAVEHLPVTVHAFEVVVLQRIHGDRVVIDENADLPAGLTEASFDPEDEFSRLEQRYGIDPDTKQSFASQAFGGLHGFLAMLDGAEEGADPAAARKTTAARKTKARAEG